MRRNKAKAVLSELLGDEDGGGGGGGEQIQLTRDIVVRKPNTTHIKSQESETCNQMDRRQAASSCAPQLSAPGTVGGYKSPRKFSGKRQTRSSQADKSTEEVVQKKRQDPLTTRQSSCPVLKKTQTLSTRRTTTTRSTVTSRHTSSCQRRQLDSQQTHTRQKVMSEFTTWMPIRKAEYDRSRVKEVQYSNHPYGDIANMQQALLKVNDLQGKIDQNHVQLLKALLVNSIQAKKGSLRPGDPLRLPLSDTVSPPTSSPSPQPVVPAPPALPLTEENELSDIAPTELLSSTHEPHTPSRTASPSVAASHSVPASPADLASRIHSPSDLNLSADHTAKLDRILSIVRKNPNTFTVSPNGQLAIDDKLVKKSDALQLFRLLFVPSKIKNNPGIVKFIAKLKELGLEKGDIPNNFAKGYYRLASTPKSTSLRKGLLTPKQEVKFSPSPLHFDSPDKQDGEGKRARILHSVLGRSHYHPPGKPPTHSASRSASCCASRSKSTAPLRKVIRLYK